jgi:hypothetical protein
VASSNIRKLIVWGAQAVIAAILVGFVGRSLVANWTQLSTLDVRLHVRPLWIISAAVTVWLTYGLLIEAWRQVLFGWKQSLGYGQAMRIWCLSNLGRYLPGKVWSLVGLAVLAQRTGVAGWAAAGSAVAMQALAIGTGALVVSVGAPGAATPLPLAGASLVAACVVAALAWERLASRVVRIVRPGAEFHALPPRTVILAAAATLASWIAYGMAFLMLANGLFDDASMSAVQSAGVFAAGYIVGLLALFAPGGIGVRELVFVALLAPVFGSGGALALSVAARLLLTATEAAAGLAALFVAGGKESLVGKTT